MIVLYRIENDKGHGPYTGNEPFLTGVHNDEEHPNRIADMPIDDYFEWVEDREYISLCACTSLDYLFKWFDGYIEQLINNGFSIYRYVVKKAVIGMSGRQAFFRPEDFIKCNKILTR